MTARRKVLIISHDADLAGVNYRIKKAFDKFSERYEVRQVVGALNYIKYPYDIMWMGNNTLVNELYDKADLVHMTEHHRTLTDFTPVIWQPVRKPTVLHQHGTTFRTNVQYYTRMVESLGWTQVVSTIDLAALSDAVEWVPNPVDVAMMRGMRRKRDTSGPSVHFMHAPTSRHEKHTALFEANLIRISAENPKITYEIVEGKSWNDALARKLHADVFYDQLNYGYGNNGIESMAMGIPTIGGFANQELVNLLPDHGFYPSSKETLGDDLRAFASLPSLRRHWSEKGIDYVKRVHEESVVVRKWESVYDRTIEAFTK